jgi:phytoene dehydrogenase-like protein
VSDVVVISAGFDGFAAAHVLAAGGRRVILVQEQALPERATGWVPPALLDELGLKLDIRPHDPWLRAPLPGGEMLELSQDMRRSVESIRRVSARDAEKWPEFCERMARLGDLLARLYVQPAPSLVDLRFAMRVRRLGRQGMEDLMRTLPMPVAELLDDWFENDVLKGALGALAVADFQQGPRSAGTAFRLLHFHAGSEPGVFRRPSSNIGQVLRARGGVEVRAGKIARIAIRAGNAAGVVLESGEELAASIVVADVPPQRALLDLVEPGWLDPDLARAVRHIRCRGVAGYVRFELERAADWWTLTLAPSLDYVERAYDDVKYGRVSASPIVDAVADGATVDVKLQFVPHDAPANDLAALATRLLAPHMPPIKRQAALSPPDLARLSGWPQGQPHHAELSLDQALWMRPLPELAQYRTPIGGLWLCGQGMHPGAGVIGAAGYNCARAILRA